MITDFYVVAGVRCEIVIARTHGYECDIDLHSKRVIVSPAVPPYARPYAIARAASLVRLASPFEPAAIRVPRLIPVLGSVG